MSDYPDAIEYYVDRSRVFTNQNTHSAIVVHGTGGNPNQTAQQLGDYFRSNADMVSSHYGIDRNGVVAQYVQEQDGAGANCCIMPGHDTFWDQFGGDNLNKHTISVEHENDLTNSLQLSDDLSKKYGIAPDHIKSHASIDPANRAHCPGPAFPWNELWDYLKGGSSMSNVPDGWKDNGSILTAPNGMLVRDGFRNYVLANDWDQNDWPLEREHAQNPLEIGNATLGGGTQQVFRFSMLGWTARTGVIREYIGKELLALRAQKSGK